MTVVSVITPTYNRESTLLRTINSVLNQTYTNFEYIIVDDCSTDNTKRLVKEIDDERLKYIKLDKNRGANAARNEGIRQAQGKYISFLDSDDQFTPEHLIKIVSVLEEAPSQVGGVYTSERHVKNNKCVDINSAKLELSNSKQVIHDYPAGGFSGLTFRAEIFNTVGLLDESLRAFQDREFLVRLLMKYELHPISDNLVIYNIHEGRLSNNAKRKLSALNNFSNKHKSIFGRREWGYIHYTKGFLLMKDDCPTNDARKCFFKAVWNDPLRPRFLLQLVFSLFGRSGFILLNQIKRKTKFWLLNLRNSI